MLLQLNGCVCIWEKLKQWRFIFYRCKKNHLFLPFSSSSSFFPFYPCWAYSIAVLTTAKEAPATISAVNPNLLLLHVCRAAHQLRRQQQQQQHEQQQLFLLFLSQHAWFHARTAFPLHFQSRMKEKIQVKEMLCFSVKKIFFIN